MFTLLRNNPECIKARTAQQLYYKIYSQGGSQYKVSPYITKRPLKLCNEIIGNIFFENYLLTSKMHLFSLKALKWKEFTEDQWMMNTQSRHMYPRTNECQHDAWETNRRTDKCAYVVTLSTDNCADQLTTKHLVHKCHLGLSPILYNVTQLGNFSVYIWASVVLSTYTDYLGQNQNHRNKLNKFDESHTVRPFLANIEPQQGNQLANFTKQENFL